MATRHLQLVIPDASEEERQDILKVQGAIYESDYLSSVRPFDGIRDMFRILTESGARVALATDCKGLAFKRISRYWMLMTLLPQSRAATMSSTENLTLALWGWHYASLPCLARRL